jgi:hypothetical protein
MPKKDPADFDLLEDWIKNIKLRRILKFSKIPQPNKPAKLTQTKITQFFK